MSGSRGGRGGRGGRGRGGRGSSGGSGGPQGPPAVQFNLFASSQFDMSECPAQIVNATVPGARRLALKDNLGDIMYWFAATAVAEPSARLVLWQGTRDDKAWLSSFVKQHLPQIQVGDEVDSKNNKYLKFQLMPEAAAAGAAAAGIKQVQPAELAKAAAAEEAAPAASEAAVEQEKPKPAAEQRNEAAKPAAANANSAPAAAVAKEVSNHVAHATAQVHDAAHAVSSKVQEASQAAGHKAAAAVQHVSGAVKSGDAQAEGNDQAALKGESGRNAQLMAIGGIAAGVVVAVGTVLGLLRGGRRKHRA